MKRAAKILLILMLLGLGQVAGAQQSSLREDVMYLTDSLRAGRGFGSGGATAASFYIVRQFRGAGLRTYTQSFTSGGKSGHNVIGVTPGWYKRYIVIGAYVDGLGATEDSWYPGADSNASGVAAMLCLARQYAAACTGDTGMVFVAFDGHNSSMSGSREALAMLKRDYRISLMVNLDILGSTKAPLHKERPDYLIALGGSSFRFSIENANRTIGLDLSYDYYGSDNFTNLFYRRISDQRWFLEAGINSVMFTSGITMSTNKTADTAESLDYDVFGKRVELISKWIGSQL